MRARWNNLLAANDAIMGGKVAENMIMGGKVVWPVEAAYGASDGSALVAYFRALASQYNESCVIVPSIVGGIADNSQPELYGVGLKNGGGMSRNISGVGVGTPSPLPATGVVRSDPTTPSGFGVLGAKVLSGSLITALFRPDDIGTNGGKWGVIFGGWNQGVNTGMLGIGRLIQRNGVEGRNHVYVGSSPNNLNSAPYHLSKDTLVAVPVVPDDWNIVVTTLGGEIWVRQVGTAAWTNVPPVGLAGGAWDTSEATASVGGTAKDRVYMGYVAGGKADASIALGMTIASPDPGTVDLVKDAWDVYGA